MALVPVIRPNVQLDALTVIHVIHHYLHVIHAHLIIALLIANHVRTHAQMDNPVLKVLSVLIHIV